MTTKILIADDSATIQKVIAITLANGPYELSETLSEEDLFKKIQIQSYDLILLDFSLSQKTNPYDLIKQVKEKAANSKIISLVGTFDSADDAIIKKSGAHDKLTKPFESSKFVKKISEVLESGTSSIDLAFNKSEPTPERQDWVVNAPKIQDQTSEKFTIDEIKSESHVLHNELDSWGMIPPVIGTAKPVHKEAEEDLWKVDVPISNQIPSGHDLDYPDAAPPKSKLIPLSALAKEEEVEHIPVAAAPRSIEINLEDELADDLQTAEEFWATEERAIITDPAIKDMAAGFSQINLSPSFERHEEKAQAQNIDEDKIVSQVVAKMTPIIERLIKEYCVKSVDKVAWEVIPDLAENLINREIKELSRKAQQG